VDDLQDRLLRLLLFLEDHLRTRRQDTALSAGAVPPRFVLVSARLLLKLEAILGHLNETGLSTPTLNESIGNTTQYSRHLYGDAADVFIDLDQDGRLDDLNGDGVENLEDAQRLFDLVEEATVHEWYSPFIGGLGLYGPATHRGGFIHVDTRGFRVRW